MEPMIRCPRDDTELRGRIVAGTIFPFRIDECTKCGGTWFDRGELRKVTHDAELEKILRDYATPGPNPIACLRDQAPMNRRVIEDVEIDVCESCGGFWVDGGELQELVSAAKDVESSGDPERPLISELEPRDIAILAWIAPGTFTKFQHETRRPTFR